MGGAKSLGLHPCRPPRRGWAGIGPEGLRASCLEQGGGVDWRTSKVPSSSVSLLSSPGDEVRMAKNAKSFEASPGHPPVCRRLRAGPAHQGHAGWWGDGYPPSLLLPVLVFASANLIQFGRIIEHLTGRHALIYNGYGCYCGWGGSRQPVDATDWCCRVHDCCYQALSLRHCKPKVEKYFYSVRKDTVTCGGETECQRQTCECDKAAALCFRRSTFQDRYICYPNLLCQGPTPPCQDACPLRKGG